ncbi:site-specific integrase [Rothia sp. LK2588]|uniref:tyrosine recombinase XerC n=1 Tax=Rothia sp. LK2588 TaxID=3114369 RepID=UPI0034CE8DA4
MDGRLRLVQATGRTRAAAEEELRARLVDRSYQATSAELGRTSTVGAAARLWREGLAEKKLSPTTLDRYEYVTDRFILPRMGDLSLVEVTPGRVGTFLTGLKADAGATNAKHARTILKQVFALAVSFDAVTTNPVDSAPTVHVERVKETTALTVEQVQGMRAHLTGDVRDVYDFMLGTGCRISEVLGLRWQDVHLDEEYVQIVGAVKLDKHKPVWAARPKSDGSAQKIHLPRFALEALAHRAPVTPIVFPSAAGTLYNPHNFRKQWRKQVAGTDYAHVHPHMIRATVATHVARVDSVAHASALLGHSDENITLRHYVAQQKESPNLVRVLEAFGE